MDARELQKKFGPLLRPFARSYALLMAGRRKLYARGFLPSFRPRLPCVAVGNIAWGGTGKTPFTAWLLNWAGQRGLKAVVLTRGYGGNPGQKPLLVRPETGPEQSGDEALALALAFPEASILAFPDRGESARHARDHLAPDLFVMDDGMQHLGMGRHADIVLLRPEDLDGEWNRVLPAGSWREGPSALAAASVFAIRAESGEFARLAPLAEKRLSRFGKALFSFTLVPQGLRPMPAGAVRQEKDAVPGETQRPVSPNLSAPGPTVPGLTDPALLDEREYRGRPYILVSGVGNPAQVERSARALLGRPPARHFAFADHHAYTAPEVRVVASLSAASLPVICTAKDAVKLRAFSREWGGVPVWVMETELRFGPFLFAEEGFPQWWEKWWQAKRKALAKR